VWVPRDHGETRPPNAIPESERFYFLEERYPAFGNLVPRDIASRAAKAVCDDGLGVGPVKRGVYLDFRDAIATQGRETIAGRYGNLFDMYRRITDVDPYVEPMQIYPAPHYTMGGLWVDYELQTTIPGLFAIGEANFSDHGANRLGASAMMQCLADGYFIVPRTVTNYLSTLPDGATVDHPAFAATEREVVERIERLMGIGGRTAPQVFHRQLGQIMLDRCGMSRHADGLAQALREIAEVREAFWSDLFIDGTAGELNPTLEYAGRLADFLELAELMCLDALRREESCGGHFREEHQRPDGEALRDDERFAKVTAWAYDADGVPVAHDEELAFDEVALATRSYK
jgi:succinate dehydrogenase / fumarate reductase flavoprotein subunit